MGELKNNETVYVTDLSASLRVSPVTIRKDLLYLENSGYATRFHGGAQLISKNFKDKDDSSYSNDETLRLIAMRACEEIQEGDSIFLGSGKTCCLLAKMLSKFDSLSIVTNNVTAFEHLTKQNHKLHLVGGEVLTVDGETYFASSLDAAEYLANMYVTKAFTSITGVDINAGLTVTSMLSTYLYKFIRNLANTWYLMLDHSKFDHIALYTVEKDIKSVQCYITDNISDKYAEYFKQNDIRYISENV